MTLGETAFSEYLTKCGLSLDFERPVEGKRKRPDFTICWSGRDIVFDVKDLQGTEEDFPAIEDLVAETEEKAVVAWGGAGDPYRWIREQIEQGRRKFQEYKGVVCAVVMFPAGGGATDLEEPDFVLGSMYGDYGIVIPLNPTTSRFDGEPQSRFLGRGKMIRPKWRKAQNTTISALVTLRSVRIGQARSGSAEPIHRRDERPRRVLVGSSGSIKGGLRH